MVRIWAKVLIEEKIIKDMIYENQEKFDFEHFFDYISDICQNFDISTPVILSKHISHYVNFNNATFLPSDFAETVSFDKFVIEEASNY